MSLLNFLFPVDIEGRSSASLGSCCVCMSVKLPPVMVLFKITPGRILANLGKSSATVLFQLLSIHHAIVVLFFTIAIFHDGVLIDQLHG